MNFFEIFYNFSNRAIFYDIISKIKALTVYERFIYMHKIKILTNAFSNLTIGIGVSLCAG